VTPNRKNNLNVIDLGKSLKDKEAEIELLQRTFTEIGSELNLDRIFQIVSERARKLINAKTLLIPLLDENCETYTYRGGSGENADEIVGESLPLEFGVCGWVWKHKKPWWRGVLDELSEDERNLWEGEAANLILVPLQGHQHFLGGIAGINKVGAEEFTSRDLSLLQMFASIVSVAIENATAVKRMEETSKLNDDYRKRLEILNKQLVESNKELEYLSLYDTVTSLPNRSLFHDRLSRNISLAELNKENVGLILIDLDRFKEINEVLGHDMGDLLLKKIARRFQKNVLSNETLGRLGGDEFVIILPAHDEERAIKRAKEFLISLKEPFSIDNTEVAVNASMGIAMYPDHGEDINVLLSHADSAMYMAKSNNLGVSLYNPDFDHSTPSHLTMGADLRKALEEYQFELYYQPKVSILTNQVVSVEALGRWNKSLRGEVPPTIFIRSLEQNGLIDDYTYWAIETAIKQAMAWDKKGHRIRVAVNVSPQTLMSRDFVINLHRLIKDESYGQFIAFEITENLFLSEYERLSEVLEYICFLGVTLSIDDYGTGYSSLSRLRKLPVSEIKIDQSFVREMARSVDSEIIVRSTIELAHNLGLLVVAEGVEEKETLDLLKNLGCDIAQGYLISRPLPADEFEEFMKNYHS
jgi:diguanylate cyclase (GGDEF)-like protein